MLLPRPLLPFGAVRDWPDLPLMALNLLRRSLKMPGLQILVFRLFLSRLQFLKPPEFPRS
jgi:hypothetical protein